MALLLTRQAAERLGVTPHQLRGLIVTGRIKAQRQGRYYLIEEKDLKIEPPRLPWTPLPQPDKA